MSLRAQQPQGAPPAPVPPAIASAKKIFISNAGEESSSPIVSRWYSGGPNRAYNEFYAAMKGWGKFELVTAPTDADVVFEVGFDNKPNNLFQLKLVILDPKIHVTLWTITKYVELASMAKNREQNYNGAMSALVTDLKTLVSPGPSAASQK